MTLRIGVDLGGTKVEAIALERDGTELERRRVSTPRNDYAGTIRTIVELVEGIEKDLDRRGTVGLGIPGAISPATGLVKNANSIWLNGQPFDHDLEEAFGRPVKLANDADCMALSEATDGAGKGAATVWAIILGTGAGSGIVVNGRLLSGPNAIAGEWGHNPLPWPNADELPGPDCYCGKTGCNETFISGTGLGKDHTRVTGEEIPAVEVVKRAEAGDAAAMASLDRYVDRLARATAAVINIIDPHVIVLGGGMSNVSRLYEDLPRLWQKYVFSDTVTTTIRPPVHGDSTGVRGAAWLWPLQSRN